MTIKYLDSKRISLLEADRTLYQGYDGGSGLLTGAYSGGGGGGSSSAGGNATTSASGTGGTSTNSSITGSPVEYAGGGSGGSYSDPVGAAGGAGAGLGALSVSGSSGATGEDATIANRGSGGGGGGWNGSSGTGAGNGSDGIVILRFTTSGNGYGQVGGTVDSSTVAGQTIITYTATSGTTFTPTSAFDVQYLVVAGGAGGGDRVSGGGGAGGLLTGTGFGVTAQAYTITVGAKGTGGSSNNGGSNGGNSVFSTITSIGGGAGAGWATSTGGSNGGSGGGGMDGEQSYTTIGGTGTSSDITPTNVQDNSILVEKDTGKRYWYDADATYTTVEAGATADSNGGSAYLTYKQITGLTAGDLISHVTFDVYNTPANTSYKGGVYTDSGNNPVTLLASGELTNQNITTTYTTLSIPLTSNATVPSSGIVWVAIVPNKTNPLIRVTTASASYTNSKYDASSAGGYTNYANLLTTTATVQGAGGNNVRFGVKIYTAPAWTLEI